MIWTGYNILQAGKNFTVHGDWKKEPWLNEDGSIKEEPLYQPGDKFEVNEEGWLIKVGGADVE